MSHSLKEYWSKLEESERKHRLLFENAKDAVFLLDAERDYGRIIDANPAAAKMHGYSRYELLNLNRRDLLAPDHAKKFDERFKNAIHDKRFVAESIHVRKDGTVFPVEVSASLINIDGHKYFLTFDRDITERKQAEEKLIRTEQMKLCGEMAASLAHEIKNPLAGIMASIEVLHDELNITEDDRMVMKTIIEEIRRIESLLNELLNFARPVRPQRMPVNANNIIESILTVQASPKDREIRVMKNLDGSLPDIVVDPMQIKQALLNLYANAVEAMPDGGAVSIRTSADEHKGMVLIEIADTGAGITEEVKERIFQPFFSTKSKGTGLGLAITKQIIEQHGGIIHAYNNKEGGAVFTISLPFASEHGGCMPEGKIFVLDDDKLIVMMLERALKKSGYTVKYETTVGDIIDKIKSFSPDVLLLDVNLPEKSGIDILREIKEEGIPAQVVMLTSDNSAETAVKAIKMGAVDYLTKPFNMEEVKIVINNLIEKLRLVHEVEHLRRVRREYFRKDIIGESPAILRLKSDMQKIAEVRVSSVLITGESGTGKELMARCIHRSMFGDCTQYASPL